MMISTRAWLSRKPILKGRWRGVLPLSGERERESGPNRSHLLGLLRHLPQRDVSPLRLHRQGHVYLQQETARLFRLHRQSSP